MKKILIGIALFCAGCAWGALTVRYQLFPMDQVRYLKNAIIPEVREPNPRNTVFQAFSPKADVVMIGDSITEQGEWSEIFPDVKIANRGIGGDRTDDILRRMDAILAVKPGKAFVMAGVNDVYAGFDTETILGNYTAIVEQLRQNGIEVYIQSTLECGRCGSNLGRIRELNKRLKDYAEKRSIPFIDINEGLTSEEGLLPEFTPDGIHLLGAGYAVWAKTLEPYAARSAH